MGRMGRMNGKAVGKRYRKTVRKGGVFGSLERRVSV